MLLTCTKIWEWDAKRTACNFLGVTFWVQMQLCSGNQARRDIRTVWVEMRSDCI